MVTSISFVKKLFPYVSYKFSYLETKKDVYFELKTRRRTGVCPKCNKRCSKIERITKRKVRDLNISGKKCFLLVPQKKIRCTCGFRGYEKIEFLEKNKRFTKRFEREVQILCELMTLKDVANYLNLNWKTVKSIDYRHLKEMFSEPPELTRRIAIDEIAILKGHKYFTIIRDYDEGRALKIIFGRSYEKVKAKLLELGTEFLSNIHYACMDMWDPYIRAITETCPNAKIVFDKFHVVQEVNKAVDSVRKKEFAKANSEERKRMKKKRFIILKKRSNLKRNEAKTLKELLQSNSKLYSTYLMKEKIQEIFSDVSSDFETIKANLIGWIEDIFANDMQDLFGVAKRILNYFYGVLNYFRYGMTNAISEGFNTKINVIKRKAFGYRDLDYFMLKIYQSSCRRFAKDWR